MYSVKILKDSFAPSGKRLTTWELTYPRFVHSELMTHRVFSRNAASSRAVPISKLIERVKTDPALPVWWGKNQAGMKAREELDPVAREQAIAVWLEARDAAVAFTQKAR
jgi:thymidylate synthase ThyX